MYVRPRLRYEEQDEEGYQFGSIHAQVEKNHSEHGHRD
jgi:hypothetical protein